MNMVKICGENVHIFFGVEMTAREYIPGLSSILTGLGISRDEAGVIIEGITSNQPFDIEAYIPLTLLENEILPFLELRDAINLQLKMLKPDQRPPSHIWLERLRQANPNTYPEVMMHWDLFKRRYDPELALTKAVRQVYAQSDRNKQDADVVAILIMLGLFDDPTVVGDYVGFGMTADNYILYLQLSTANLQDVMDVYGEGMVSDYTIFAFLLNHGVRISGIVILAIIVRGNRDILNLLEDYDFDLTQDDVDGFTSFFYELMNKGYLKFIANYMRNAREQELTIHPWMYREISRRLDDYDNEDERIALERILHQMPVREDEGEDEGENEEDEDEY